MIDTVPKTIPCLTNPVVRVGGGKAYAFAEVATLLPAGTLKGADPSRTQGHIYMLRPRAAEWVLVALEDAVAAGLAHRMAGGRCTGCHGVLSMIEGRLRERAS